MTKTDGQVSPELSQSDSKAKPWNPTELLQNEKFRWCCTLVYVCVAILIPVLFTANALCDWSPIPVPTQPSSPFPNPLKGVLEIFKLTFDWSPIPVPTQPSSPFPNPLKGVLEIFKLTFEISALLIGGAWAIQRFILSRPDQWSVNISTETKQHLLNNNLCMLIVSVTLENVSAVRISLSKFETQVDEIKHDILKLVEPGQSRSSSDDKPKKPEIDYSLVTLINHHSLPGEYLIEPKTKYVEEFAVIVNVTSVIQLVTEVKRGKNELPINQRRFVVIKQKKISSCKSQGGVAAVPAPPA